MNIKNRIRKLETEVLPVGESCRCESVSCFIIQTEQTAAASEPETCHLCGKVINRIEATFKISTN